MRKRHKVHLQSPSCHLEFCTTLHLPCPSIFITLISLSPKDNSCLFLFAQTDFSVLTYSELRSAFPLARHFSFLVLACLYGAIGSWGDMNNRFLKDKKTLKMEIRNLERVVLTPEYKSDVFQFNTYKEFILWFCSKLLCRTSWLVALNLKSNVCLCIGKHKICKLKGGRIQWRKVSEVVCTTPSLTDNLIHFSGLHTWCRDHYSACYFLAYYGRKLKLYKSINCTAFPL